MTAATGGAVVTITEVDDDPFRVGFSSVFLSHTSSRPPLKKEVSLSRVGPTSLHLLPRVVEMINLPISGLKLCDNSFLTNF